MIDYVRAYEGNEPYIFVSYAHLDSDVVIPVIRALYARKYRVWYDEGISPGSEWPENIEQHLNDANTVLVFVSTHSLNSKNCENEVRAATGQKPKAEGLQSGREQKRNKSRRQKGLKKEIPDKKKKIITVSLDGASLSSDIQIHTELPYDDGRVIEALSNGTTLTPDLIGDGVSGYAYAIGQKKHFNIWNLLLGMAAVMICALLVSLYGLYVGWFDVFLPAKQIVEQTTSTPQPKEEAVSIDETLIGNVLPVAFSSDAERDAVYGALGWTGTAQMTYYDLNTMDWVTQLDLTGTQVADLSFAAYLPNLEILTLYETPVVDLLPLSGCPNLKMVQVTANMLPLSVASDRTFELEVS